LINQKVAPGPVAKAKAAPPVPPKAKAAPAPAPATQPAKSSAPAPATASGDAARTELLKRISDLKAGSTTRTAAPAAPAATDDDIE